MFVVLMECACLSLVLCNGFLRLAFCFFKQKTAYEMRISDWSSDVCSSDLNPTARIFGAFEQRHALFEHAHGRIGKPAIDEARLFIGEALHRDRKSVV